MRLAPRGDHGRFRALKSPQDLAAGLFFLGIGLFALWAGRDYPVGTPQRMGTGAFPRMLCWGLVGLGAIISVQSLFADGQPLTRWALRPLIWVSLGILAFALLLEPAGLVLATTALFLLTALGSPETRWGEVLIFTAGTAAFGVALFVWGLGLTLRVWPL